MRPVGRHWIMARRPDGALRPDDLALRDAPAAELADGETELAAIYLSIDPTTRLWMADVAQHAAPLAVGAPVRAFVHGRVLRTRNRHLATGDLVWATGVWAERMVVRTAHPVGPSFGLPLAAHAGILGLTGLTAWFGLALAGRPQPGQTVVISGATGAVGSVAGQLASQFGATAIGIVGTAERAAHAVSALGYAAAVVRGPTLAADLRAACPTGVDIVFENAAGPVLDAALGAINPGARIILCGMMSGYESAGAWPANQLRPILMKQARIEGFLISSCFDRLDEGRRQLAERINDGRMRWEVDVLHGLGRAPDALIRLLAGRNRGKQLVQLADDPWA